MSFAVKVIDGVMRQLLSRDLMYEPMKQICERFPAWLATNKYVHISETPKLLSFRVIKSFIFLMRLLFAVTSAINSPSFSQSSLPLSSSLFSFLLSLPPRPSLYNSLLTLKTLFFRPTLPSVDYEKYSKMYETFQTLLTTYDTEPDNQSKYVLSSILHTVEDIDLIYSEICWVVRFDAVSCSQ